MIQEKHNHSILLAIDDKCVNYYYNIPYWLSSEFEEYYSINDAAPTITKPLEKDNEGWVSSLEKKNSGKNDVPNGIRVSKTNNPLIFPVENTYRVGNSIVIAMCSNAVAVGTGQTGEAPLYVFCTDGIYALMVDASGDMAYSSARIISRDICNNAASVTPIDNGVVFSTDRGLMMIAGDKVEELGQPLEGDFLHFGDIKHHEYMKIASNAYKHPKIASLPDSSLSQVDFLTYLKGCIINYNHNERELMVSNAAYDYTYIMDRFGNWSRRDYTCQEYVNNYPTSYRLHNGEFYKVDEEDNGRDTADNEFFYLSHLIKLGTLGFKQGYRFVVRGYFDTRLNILPIKYTQDWNMWISKEHKIDFPKARWGYNYELKLSDEGTPSNYRVEIRCDRTDGVVNTISSKDIVANSEGNILSFTLPTNPIGQWKTPYICLVNTNDGSSVVVHAKLELYIKYEDNLGLYIFGSYDGRRWAMLGGNEKAGSFVDIGCKIERTDVKFYRVCLAGKLTKDSRISYMEMSAEPSRVLSGKLR